MKSEIDSIPEDLGIWTIYENPKDFPGKFVARYFVGTKPTSAFLTADSIDPLREHMMRLGLVHISRQPGDEPQIREIWL